MQEQIAKADRERAMHDRSSASLFLHQRAQVEDFLFSP